MAADVCRTFLWEKTRREINTHTHTHCCFSSCQQPVCVSSYLVSCPSHDAHIPQWGGGTAVVYFDNGWKIPLPSLGLLRPPWAFGVYFSTCSVIMREFSTESVWSCGAAAEGPSTGSQFFSRMYIKASYASGGISSGNRRDSPHEQDDDIVFIVFLFFHSNPPSALNSLLSTAD